MMKNLNHILLISLLFLTTQISFAASAPIVRFQKASDGVFRGGRPGIEGIKFLHQIGIKTIVTMEDDLSEVKEEQNRAKNLGIQFVSIPINTFAKVDDRNFSKVLAILLNTNNHPVYVHCQFGKDRTGVAVGLYRVFHDHWTPQDAYEEMLHIGFNPILKNMSSYFFLKTKNF